MSTVNAPVACIVAREMLEGIMFVSSHTGAVYKSQLSTLRKIEYYKYITFGSIAGLLCGLAISLGVGFGLASLSEKGIEDAELGMEAGEAVSKLIGFFFVTKMMFKLPQWFNISNFVGPKKAIPRGQTSENGESTDESIEFGTPIDFFFNLFWNILRESAETGCFVSVEVFLSLDAKNTLDASVITGVFTAIGFSLIWGYGSMFMSVKPFAILAAVVIEMLAVGLFTGSVHAFEEVHHEATGAKETPYVWYANDPALKSAISVFSWFGLKGSFTALQFVAWILSAAILTYFQIQHNYYGKPLPSFKNHCGFKTGLESIEVAKAEIVADAKDFNKV